MLKSFGALSAVALAVIASHSAVGANGLPPGVFPAERDYKQAPAGDYALDVQHTSVIAKVSHLGYSLSVFRFERVSGTLNWNPAQPSGSSLQVSVATASIATPVPGFAAELAGDGYLKSTTYPDATFVSTKFQKIDSTHGRVTGQFTLLGKTAPLAFDVTLEGAGKGFMGHPRIGVEATANIRPKDFGLPQMLGDSIQLVIDSEFEQKH